MEGDALYVLDACQGSMHATGTQVVYQKYPDQLASNCSTSGECSRQVTGTQVVFWDVLDQVWLSF